MSRGGSNGECGDRMPLISIEKGDVLAFHISACVNNEKNMGSVNIMLSFWYFLKILISGSVYFIIEQSVCQF